MALITSNAIETVPYAEALRSHLANHSSIEEIHFFPGIQLFENVGIFNTIFILTKTAPVDSHVVTRFFHQALPASEQPVATQQLPQVTYGVNVFRQHLPALKIKGGIPTVPLNHLFYVSKGMVLHADERAHPGAFAIDDLLSDVRDAEHPTPFAGSKDVDEFGIRRVRYLEYGGGTRVPSQVSRPTFPELYNRNKLMVAEFGGFAFDDGTWDDVGHLKCNHSVFVLLPWHLIEEVQNRSIRDQLKELGNPDRASLEAVSQALDLWYTLGFLNSKEMYALLTGVARSAIVNRRQPDDLRQILLPLPGPDITSKVAQAAKKAAHAQKKLLTFRSKGWEIEGAIIAASGAVPSNVRTKPLAVARASWQLTVHLSSAKVGILSRSGNNVYKGTRKVMSVPDGTPEQALDWLVHQLNALPDGTTLETAEQQEILIPATPADGVKAFAKLMTERATVQNLLQQIATAKDQISESLGQLFERVEHPPIEQGGHSQVAESVQA